ncbi:hypothetical protein [Cellulomonas sp. NS3]|uniref:hypothetical protein n=1 Tax=Cellulomonas sp. NS3 TaxID=2973977 RepID=UPI002161A396|nr:hypothetical protein [Cellulomonas sp. NS3]
MTDLEHARAAKDRLRQTLAGRDGITGIGISRGADGYGVQVNVSQAAHRAAVPEHVDGVDVRVRVTGPVHAQPVRRSRHAG